MSKNESQIQILDAALDSDNGGSGNDDGGNAKVVKGNFLTDAWCPQGLIPPHLEAISPHLANSPQQGSRRYTPPIYNIIKKFQGGGGLSLT